MLIERPKSFISPEFIVRQAVRPWEISASARLRHDTFVKEQRIFNHHDRDEIDENMILGRDDTTDTRR